MLKTAVKFLKAINSETDPGQIALALVFGMIAGLTPFWSLHNLLVLFLALVIRVNFSSFLGSLLVFSVLGYLLDPLFHALGLAVLEAGALSGLWTALYNTTLGRLSHFYNSVLMGSLLLSLILAVPGFFLFKYLILKYREHVLAWVKKSRIMQALMATRFYRMYQSYESWKG